MDRRREGGRDEDDICLALLIYWKPDLDKTFTAKTMRLHGPEQEAKNFPCQEPW
jgi:hypothetical protein